MRSIPAGLLLPESFLQSEFFLVLSTFVAINTLMYVTLAIAKMLPRIYLSDFRSGRNRRREPRGIIPAPAEPEVPGHPDDWPGPAEPGVSLPPR
jgi:hypothetical protein